jgi:hypothetical protein
MATEKTEKTEKSEVATSKPTSNDSQPVFKADEFAAHPLVFGDSITPECVTAAFFVAGKKEATKEEAKEIVDKFMRREIK